MKTREARKRLQAVTIQVQQCAGILAELQLELLRIELGTEPEQELDEKHIGLPLDVDNGEDG